ncbi:MAG TPA: MBL fold metallo-hydrolase [Nitrososphaeraceae archaeon]|nr:MBL fold metallo-hydrolase [Nitrososphaeraceae archaeon]
MKLQEINKVTITILTDNSTDLLLSNSIHVIRPPLMKNEKFNLPVPIAEHGFSALIRISVDSKENDDETNVRKKAENAKNNTLLFDAGPSQNGVIHNADIFGIDFALIDGVILSHGHFDHFEGLPNILKKISSSRRTSAGIDLIVHPDAFLKRWKVYNDGNRAQMPNLDEEHLKNWEQLYIKGQVLHFCLVANHLHCWLQVRYQERLILRRAFRFSMLRIKLVTKQRLSPIHWLGMIKR